MINRDSGETTGAKFVEPVHLYSMTHAHVAPDDPEQVDVYEKAKQWLLRKFKKAGLLGLPIFADTFDSQEDRRTGFCEILRVSRSGKQVQLEVRGIDFRDVERK